MRKFFKVFKGRAYDRKTFPQIKKHSEQGSLQASDHGTSSSNGSGTAQQSYVQSDGRSVLSEYCGSMGKFG